MQIRNMYNTCNIDTDKIRAAYTKLNHNHSQFATGLEIHRKTVKKLDNMMIKGIATIGPPCSKAQGSDYDQD